MQYAKDGITLEKHKIAVQEQQYFKASAPEKRSRLRSNA